MPDWNPEIQRRLSPMRLSPTHEVSVAEELAQHLDDHYQELIGSGTSAEEARSAALAGLDRHELLRELQQLGREKNWEPVTPARSDTSLFSGLGGDLRYTARVLRKAPGFSMFAVLTIAIGIAANTAIFSIINSLFLHPPGVTDSDRLMAVRAKYENLNLKNIDVSLTDFADVRDHPRRRQSKQKCRHHAGRNTEEQYGPVYWSHQIANASFRSNQSGIPHSQYSQSDSHRCPARGDEHAFNKYLAHKVSAPCS